MLTGLNEAITAVRDRSNIERARVAAVIRVHAVAIVALFAGVNDGITAPRTRTVGTTLIGRIGVVEAVIALLKGLVHNLIATVCGLNAATRSAR